MGKKIIFVFAGTAVKALSEHNFWEQKKDEIEGQFNKDVIRVYIDGCQERRVGGRRYILGLLDPDLDVVSHKLRKFFSSETRAIDIALLKKEFGESIIIEPSEGLNSTEEIDDITMLGTSRGAVTAFAATRALDDLDIPISLIGEEPVPGNSRSESYNPESIYAKNADLSKCKNLAQAVILLGTYSKHNRGWENKWFRQMAPKFDHETRSYLFLVPKKFHNEFSRRSATYISAFLHQRGLIEKPRIWANELDREYDIPKTAQQKFHFGVVGRAQYIPSFKMDILRALRKHYTQDDPCTVNTGSKFKLGQALLALHHANKEKIPFGELSAAVLADTDRAKGLREFVVEFDNIVQYSKEQSPLKREQLLQITTLEATVFELIADFQKLDSPTLEQEAAFQQAILATIKQFKASIPTKVYDTLKDLTAQLLAENTLVHPNLVKFIDESETFVANMLTADQRMLDGVVTNAEELAIKLYHSSERQRSVVIEQEKPFLPQIIKTATDLANIAQFLTDQELKTTLKLNIVDLNTPIAKTIKTMSDVLLLMETLPSFNHREILYQAIKDDLADMKPTCDELIRLMEYLSDKYCKQLSLIMPIEDLILAESDTPNALMRERLTDTKISIILEMVNIRTDTPGFST